MVEEICERGSGFRPGVKEWGSYVWWEWWISRVRRCDRRMKRLARQREIEMKLNGETHRVVIQTQGEAYWKERGCSLWPSKGDMMCKANAARRLNRDDVLHMKVGWLWELWICGWNFNNEIKSHNFYVCWVKPTKLRLWKQHGMAHLNPERFVKTAQTVRPYGTQISQIYKICSFWGSILLRCTDDGAIWCKRTDVTCQPGLWVINASSLPRMQSCW